MDLQPAPRWLGLVMRLTVALMSIVTLIGIGAPGVRAEPATPTYAGGLIPSEGDFPRLPASSELFAQSLPSQVDLSAALPPVGSQGSQNSCVGWALGYYYRTFLQARDSGWSPTTAPQQFSPSWIYNQRPVDDCSDDYGMSYYSGFRILQDLGAATLADMPYQSADSCTLPSAAVAQAAATYRVLDFANVFSGTGQADLNVLKSLLARGEPFALAVPIYSSFYSVTPANPIVPLHRSNEACYGGHALFVVGYDDAIGGFLAVNSWGSNWGRDGYAYLSYDFVRYDCFEAWVMTASEAAPATFTGNIIDSGSTVTALPENTVTAWIDNVQVASGPVTPAGSGYRYAIEVPSDDPLTLEREGGVSGDVVRFRIGGYAAASTLSVWQPAQTVERDLTLNRYRQYLLYVARY